MYIDYGHLLDVKGYREGVRHLFSFSLLLLIALPFAKAKCVALNLVASFNLLKTKKSLSKVIDLCKSELLSLFLVKWQKYFLFYAIFFRTLMTTTIAAIAITYRQRRKKRSKEIRADTNPRRNI